jgi:hypothetical protein
MSTTAEPHVVSIGLRPGTPATHFRQMADLVAPIVPPEWAEGSRLLEWALWAQRAGALSYTFQAERVSGLSICRRCSADHLTQRYAVDEAGPLLAFDLLVASQPAAAELLWEAALMRWGEPRCVGFVRLKYGERPSLYPFSRFRRVVARCAAVFTAKPIKEH